MSSRRKFLAALVTTGFPIGILSYTSCRLLAQARPVIPPPEPVQRENENEPSKTANKAILESNKKEIKKDIEKLFQLASELKAEVEKTDSMQVLSMAMLKKTEEIEKLAKAIRARAIG